MEVIRDLVREIAIIVLLASFLEMLLPNSNMKHFVKVVMGLFVIITVLGPIGSFLNRELAFEVNAWQYHDQSYDKSLQTIMTQGDNFRRDTQITTVREYEKRLAQQVQAIAKLTPNINQVEAKVNVRYDQKTGQFGTIDRITLVVGPGSSEANKDEVAVKPVDIKIGQTNASPSPTGKSYQPAAQGGLVAQLKQTVASFYGLKEEQIEVIFK